MPFTDAFMEDFQFFNLPPEKKCYCCWHLAGQCPHCPKDKTGADKMRDRGNAQPSSVCQCNDAKDVAA